MSARRKAAKVSLKWWKTRMNGQMWRLSSAEKTSNASGKSGRSGRTECWMKHASSCEQLYLGTREHLCPSVLDKRSIRDYCTFQSTVWEMPCSDRSHRRLKGSRQRKAAMAVGSHARWLRSHTKGSNRYASSLSTSCRSIFCEAQRIRLDYTLSRPISVQQQAGKTPSR